MPLTLAGSGVITGADWGASGGGLTKITTQSFTAASTVSVNNCFTSTYDNYMISMSFVNSATTDVNVRLRASASDATASEYWYTVGDRVGSYLGPTVSSTALVLTYGAVSPSVTSLSVNIYRPFLADKTGLHGTGVAEKSGRSYPGTGVYIGGYHTASTSYDGFSVFPSSGTTTGTLTVYGYTK